MIRSTGCASLAVRPELVALEMTLVAKYERAAVRHADPAAQSMTARHWDRPMCQRYLAAAAQFEPEYAPRIGTTT